MFVTKAAGLLRQNSTTLDDGFDVIGELANMITGGAKRELSEQLVEVSIPCVYLGPTRLDGVSGGFPWLIVPFGQRR